MSEFGKRLRELALMHQAGQDPVPHLNELEMRILIESTLLLAATEEGLLAVDLPAEGENAPAVEKQVQAIQFMSEVLGLTVTHQKLGGLASIHVSWKE